MSVIQSTIRPAPGADGPYLVITEKDGAVTNATLGLANLNAALDQCKSDHGTALAGASPTRIIIKTETPNGA